MKFICLLLLLITIIANANGIIQEQPFNQSKYFRDQDIAINFKYTHYKFVRQQIESRNHKIVNSQSPGNQELITLFYKLLTIQV
ncbi:unnamed protein product [Paramecium octaurelia]|uniref:Uncharacterized protein n=1 Tax=Paramecium octaurelia TaxID=43137 RepID=A0A8S1UW02_PAROT|nr:unnamed protein product [Paramecium octaurelia]